MIMITIDGFADLALRQRLTEVVRAFERDTSPVRKVGLTMTGGVPHLKSQQDGYKKSFFKPITCIKVVATEMVESKDAETLHRCLIDIVKKTQAGIFQTISTTIETTFHQKSPDAEPAQTNVNPSPDVTLK